MKVNILHSHKWLFIILAIITVVGTSCGNMGNGNRAVGDTAIPAVAAEPEQTKTIEPASVIVPEVKPTETEDYCAGVEKSPEPLPSFKSSTSKFPFFEYLADNCVYLEDLFDEEKSTPGTIVMPIMFHSISDDCKRSADGSCITNLEFDELMEGLAEKGFEAISSEEFIGFLYENEKIPYRSVLLIVDDRHFSLYFDKFFRPFYDKFGWPVINAYISSNSSGRRVLDENIALENEGWVDHQAHGAFHNIPIQNWRYDAVVNGMNAYDYIERELAYPIEFFGLYFGKQPTLFVWPGGGFTRYASELAESLGYRAAFTINQRGPILFNAVPLSDENTLNMPPFVLPRYWSFSAAGRLEDVLAIQREFEAYFRENEQIFRAQLCACARSMD